MFKEQVTRQNKIEAKYDTFDESIAKLDNTNKMIDERTQGHTKNIQDLRINVDRLKELKQDKSNF